MPNYEKNDKQECYREAVDRDLLIQIKLFLLVLRLLYVSVSVLIDDRVLVDDLLVY